MIKFKSKILNIYYKEPLDEYNITFKHHNIYLPDSRKEECNYLEQDLDNWYNYNKESFLIYFSSVEDYKSFINSINVKYNDKIYLRIRSNLEYKELKELNTKVKVIVDIKDIEKLNIKDYDLVIQIDRVSELRVSKLNELMSIFNIKEILLGQIPYIPKDYSFLYDEMSEIYNIDVNNKLEIEKMSLITNDIYTTHEYIKIVNKFNNIIDSLNIKNKLDGIHKIFYYIAKNVDYDDNGVKITKITNQNLIGPVLHSIGVCEGFTKYLMQMLSLIDVDSIAVCGGDSKDAGGHIWNQVLVDGIWYNADVTYASYALRHNEEVKTFLVKDSKIAYKTNSAISYECNEDYKGGK